MDCLKDVVTSTVQHFTEDAIVQHVCYPFQVEGNINGLKSAIERLAAQKEDVKDTIMNAERRNGAATNEVKLWLKNIETVEKDAEEIHNKFQQDCGRIWNCLPNIWSNYQISKYAAKKIDEVNKLHEERSNIELVIYQLPCLAQEMPAASSSISPDLELAVYHIKDDTHGIIGIWGMGGVGKTHLLKQINNTLCRDNIFEVVIFVTCSRECSEEKIQREICKKLKLAEDGNMADAIYNFLRKRSFVLLLDDLWSHVNLDDVGIPEPYGIVGNRLRKVALTTRSEGVCNDMWVMKKIRVNVLNWDNAWSLFKEKVTEETIVSHPLIQKYAEQVVKELGGLPLALITVGRAMYDNRNPIEWKDAVELLKEAQHPYPELSGMDDSVFKLLKFSFDKLKDNNLRECFLHCSLWPEGYEIERDKLVQLWMGLGLIDERKIHKAYQVGYRTIKELQAVSLLEASDNESRVKLHDVIRDMSLWIVRNQGVEQNKWIVRSSASNEPIVIWEETEKISFMYNAEEVSFLTGSWDSRLTTFLFSCSSLTEIAALQHQPFSKLTVLNLEGNWFDVFPTEICHLISLRFIDLSGNKIVSLPNEMEALINLKYLFLKENMICSISAGTISKMKALKVLDLSPPYHWAKNEKRGKLGFVPSLLEELESLPEFGALGIEINDMMQLQRLIALPKVPVRWLTVTMWEELSTLSFPSWFLESFQARSNLFSLSITNNVDVERVSFESTFGNPSSCELGRLENLYIYSVGMKAIQWRGHDPKDIAPFLKCITICMCDRLKSISWVVHLPCLRELTVSVCHSMRQLIEEYQVSQPTFPLLKLLKLEGLLKLERIGDPDIIFPALETLEISDCRQLENVPFRTDNIPPNLNHIWVEQEWWNNVARSQGSLRSLLSKYVRFFY